MLLVARAVTLPEGEREKDVLVVLIRHGDDVVGLFSCDRDRDALTLYARLAVVKPVIAAHTSQRRASRWLRPSRAKTPLWNHAGPKGSRQGLY